MNRVLPYTIKVRCDCEVVEVNLVCEVFIFLPEKGSSKPQLIRGSSKGPVDPWKEFQLYAFSVGGPVSICRERDVFRFLMYAFNQYEFEVGYRTYT